MNRHNIIRELVDIQVGFFGGSDFLDPVSLEKSEYFRGQTEMLADMVGGCDAKAALWEPLKAACAASARGDKDLESYVVRVMEAAEEQANANGCPLRPAKRVLTAEELLGALEEIGEPAELTQFAARAAVDELVSNWIEALKEHYVLGDLLKDVDLTIELLGRWKEKLASGIDAV